MTTVKFEQLAPHGGYLFSVPDGYAGLHWTNIGAMDKAKWPGSGFDFDVHSGRAVGDTNGGASGHDRSAISCDTPFTLTSGYFAAAWNDGQTVTFTAFRGGVEVGHKVVVLDQEQTFVKFNSHFHNVDRITIKNEGGVDANPDDGGGGTFLAMDDLVIKVSDGPPPPPPYPDDAVLQHLGGLGSHDHAAPDWFLL